MNTSRSIKINFRGASHEVDPPTPATLTGLQAAVASTFGVELAARSEAGGADSDLSFTYMDSDGDDIVFDQDAELSLALRLCPSPLEISAASKQLMVEEKKEEAAKPKEVERFYRRAARSLREYHGVPSMTPPKLIRTLAFLKIRPRRLVRLGVVPAELFAGDLKVAFPPEMEMMSVEDGQKEWNGAGYSSSEEEEEEEGVGGDGDGAGASEKGEKPKPKNVLHGAFLTAGIKLREREIMPLFAALDLWPRYLLKLGHVEEKEVRGAVESLKRRHHGGKHPRMYPHGYPGVHGGGHPGMAHPGMAAHFRARGGGQAGPVGYMPGAPSSPMEGMFVCPPPPSHRADSALGGGGPGVFCGPHHHGHPHPGHGEPGHPGHFGGGGGGGGAGGCPFSPDMMVWMDARAAHRMAARAAHHIAARSAWRGRGGGACGGGGGGCGGGDGGHWYGYWG